LEILVRDEVEENCVERFWAGQLVRSIVSGSDEHIGRGLGEVPVVFSIHEEEIHTDRRRRPLQRIGDTEQQGDT
jgi:hypothetical protein